MGLYWLESFLNFAQKETVMFKSHFNITISFPFYGNHSRTVRQTNWAGKSTNTCWVSPSKEWDSDASCG